MVSGTQGQVAGGYESGQFPRIDANIILNYSVVSKEDVEELEQLQGDLAENIEQKGASFHAMENIEPGDIVRLLLAPHTISYHIHALARVVWSKKIEGTRMYDVGVHFLGLSADDIKEIEKFMSSEEESAYYSQIEIMKKEVDRVLEGFRHLKGIYKCRLCHEPINSVLDIFLSACIEKKDRRGFLCGECLQKNF